MVWKGRRSLGGLWGPFYILEASKSSPVRFCSCFCNANQTTAVTLRWGSELKAATAGTATDAAVTTLI